MERNKTYSVILRLDELTPLPKRQSDIVHSVDQQRASANKFGGFQGAPIGVLQS